MIAHIFNDEWKNWIWSNITNGVSKQRIYSDLIKHGFDPFLVMHELRFSPSFTSEEIIGVNNVSQQLMQLGAIKVNSDYPLFILKDILSKQECLDIIEIQKANNTRSTTGEDSEIKIDKDRISYSTFFEQAEMFQTYPILKALKLKIIGALGIPMRYSEALQGQWYKENGFYNIHFDAEHRQEKVDPIRGNRTWTCMITLNDVETGGATHFPKLDQTINPSSGQAVIWYNLGDNRLAHPSSLHGGLPVTQGEKFIVTQWFRELPQL